SGIKGNKWQLFQMRWFSKSAISRFRRSKRALLVVLLLASSATALASLGVRLALGPISNPTYARYGGLSMVQQNGEAVWMDDAAPAGATLYGVWTWLSGNPSPYSGTVSHQSDIALGSHQHFFEGASQTLDVGAGDRLFVYVYLDPANIPSEVMLQWNGNGSG